MQHRHQRLRASLSLILFLWGVFACPLVRVEFGRLTLGGKSHAFGQTQPTLGRIVWELLQSNSLLGVLLALSMVLFPVLLRLLLIANRQAASRSDRTTTEAIVRQWSLTPVLLLSTVVIACNQSKTLPPVFVGYGLYFLLASEIILHLGSLVSLVVLTVPVLASKVSRFLGSLIRFVRKGWRCDKRPASARPSVAPTHVVLGIVLCYSSLVALLPAYFAPFVSVNAVSLFQKGPYGLVVGIRNLYQGGDQALAVTLFCFSVLFPLAKGAVLGCFLNFSDAISTRSLAALDRLGPWSMLDAVVVILVSGAYGTVPYANITVSTGTGFWFFVVAILTNSVTLHVIQHGGSTTPAAPSP